MSRKFKVIWSQIHLCLYAFVGRRKARWTASLSLEIGSGLLSVLVQRHVFSPLLLVGDSVWEDMAQLF
jgi:hypothetical protein